MIEVEQTYYSGACKHNPHATFSDVCDECFWYHQYRQHIKNMKIYPLRVWDYARVFSPDRDSLKSAREYNANMVLLCKRFKEDSLEHDYRQSLIFLNDLWYAMGYSNKKGKDATRNTPRSTPKFFLRDIVDLPRKGAKIICLHPDHNDRTPSMSLFVGRDGKERLHCYSCHATMDEVDVYAVQKGITKQEAWKELYFD